MIRIDEIYNHTFWPWVSANAPLTRMFFCDPPGDASPSALKNFGHDVTELQYIFFHDQEPIYLDTHAALFEKVITYNLDLNHRQGPKHSLFVTSEYQSEFVEHLCAQHGWQPLYYFFHGWAALDWYRGYDRTFLITEPEHRHIVHSFICPNRIIGGRRDHRVMLMYHLLRQKVNNALISFPEICPAEGVTAVDIAAKFGPEVQQVLARADLPWHFSGETGHPMHSCWLSLFPHNASALLHVVTETVFDGRRQHLTEKTFKPICLQMPFVLVSAAGSLEYLRRYGFKTFGDLWSEDYDLEQDDATRLEKIATLLKQLDDLSQRELQQLYKAANSAVTHNFRHFYGGAFESILWQELQHMLQKIKGTIAHD